MKKDILLVAMVAALFVKGMGQELFVYSEPASNMPAKTIGPKITAIFPATNSMKQRFKPDKQRYKPELMIGINRNLMVHLSTTFSNYYTNRIRYESWRLYGKYRFYSNDEVHKHFRMAAFGDISFTRSPYLYEEMNLEGDNKGAQAGLIATKLVNKFAVSGTIAYTRLFRYSSEHDHGGEPHSLNMINYSLSTGYLVLPKEYVDYNQTNLNVYLEVLGSKSLDKNKYSLDLAPALQLIIKSNTKINFGYRFQVAGNMYRVTNQTWLVGLEHTIFNVWK